jgi:hypothetical protein
MQIDFMPDRPERADPVCFCSDKSVGGRRLAHGLPENSRIGVDLMKSGVYTDGFSRLGPAGDPGRSIRRRTKFAARFLTLLMIGRH